MATQEVAQGVPVMDPDKALWIAGLISDWGNIPSSQFQSKYPDFVQRRYEMQERFPTLDSNGATLWVLEKYASGDLPCPMT